MPRMHTAEPRCLLRAAVWSAGLLYAGLCLASPAEPVCAPAECLRVRTQSLNLLQHAAQKVLRPRVGVPQHHRAVFMQQAPAGTWHRIPCDVPCEWPQPLTLPACRYPDSVWCDQTEFQVLGFGNTSRPIRVSGGAGIIRTVIFEGLDERLTLSMESAGHYSELGHDLAHRGTTSLESAVPLQYLSWAEGPFGDAVDYGTVIKGASFLAGDCRSLNNREALVQALQAYIRVDSMGHCLHNAPIPEDTHNEKHLILPKYLFHLAFENANEPDYATEKLWQGLRSGSLPVYFGAPNIHDLVPPRSLVVVQDFGTWDDLGRHLAHLAQNRTAYMEYHAWRKKPLPDAFLEKWDFAHVHSSCRICRWAFAKREGLKWDVPTQRVLNVTA